MQKALPLYGEMKVLQFNVLLKMRISRRLVHACHNKIIEMSHVPSVAAYCSLCKFGEVDVAMMLVRA